MRFVAYRRAHVRHCKVDWEAPVDVSEPLRAALRPHDPDVLRPGRLRRPFCIKVVTPGRRSRSGFERHPAPEPVTHKAGALVFANADETVFLIEAPEGDA
jgi:hypothetical protein